MPRWVECTARSDKRTIYVNLAIAAWIVPNEDGSRVVFAGGEQDYVDVVEGPRKLLTKAPVG